MAKFSGPIGFALSVETEPGIWVEEITEIWYVGDVMKTYRKLQPGMSVNDNLAVNNQISIVADPFANRNISGMRYVRWMGAAWKIDGVEVQRPRLLLSIGGMYNG